MNKSYNRIIDVLIEARIDKINEAGRFRKAMAGAALAACIGPACTPKEQKPKHGGSAEMHQQADKNIKRAEGAIPRSGRVTTDDAIETLKRMWAAQDNKKK